MIDEKWVQDVQSERNRRLAAELVPLININRSRDRRLHVTLGLSIHFIFDGSAEGLLLWKSACVPERHDLCDELWADFGSIDNTGASHMTVGEWLQVATDVDGNHLCPWAQNYEEDSEELALDDSYLDEAQEVAIDLIGKQIEDEELAAKLLDQIETIDDLKVLLDMKIDMRWLKAGQTLYRQKTLMIPRAWAKEDSPEAYAALSEREKPENRIRAAKFGRMTWSKVISFLLKKPDVADIEGRITLGRMMRASVACISNKWYVCMPDGVAEESATKIRQMMKDIKLRWVNLSTSEKKVITLYSYVFDHGGLDYIHYENIVWIPQPDSPDPNTCNLFPGYAGKSMRVATFDDPDVQKVLRYLHVLFRGKQELVKYYVRWSAMMFCTSRKPRVGVVLYSKEKQVGKGLLADFEMACLGEGNYHKFNSPSELLEDKNGVLSHKRYILVEEHNENYRTINAGEIDKLKTLITDSKFSLRAMRRDHVQENSYHCFKFHTNRPSLNFVAAEKERFVVIDCCERQSEEWYTDYVSFFQQKEVQEKWLAYLKTVEYEDSDVYKAPVTEGMRRNAENSKEPLVLFLEEMVLANSFRRYEGEHLVGQSANCLYQEYRRWCESNGERNALTSRSFGMRLGGYDGMVEKKRTATGVYYYAKQGLVDSVCGKEEPKEEEEKDLASLSKEELIAMLIASKK